MKPDRRSVGKQARSGVDKTTKELTLGFTLDSVPPTRHFIVPTTAFISYEDGRNRRHDRLNDNYDRPNQ